MVRDFLKTPNSTCTITNSYRIHLITGTLPPMAEIPGIWMSFFQHEMLLIFKIYFIIICLHHQKGIKVFIFVTTP